MGVVLHGGGLLDQVVVGEVGSHPRLHHHGGGQLDGPADGRSPVPDLLVLLEEDRPLVAIGAGDEDEGLLAALGPGLEPHLSAPAGPDNGHGHLPVTGLAPELLIGTADDLGGRGSLSGQEKGTQQQGQ